MTLLEKNDDALQQSRHKCTHHNTTQAATAASAADQKNPSPHEGDGYLYEHLESKDELWLDFIADTGDGG